MMNYGKDVEEGTHTDVHTYIHTNTHSGWECNTATVENNLEMS